MSAKMMASGPEGDDRGVGEVTGSAVSRSPRCQDMDSSQARPSNAREPWSGSERRWDSAGTAGPKRRSISSFLRFGDAPAVSVVVAVAASRLKNRLTSPSGLLD